jgi:very-short-patch-repair endonuclease
MGKLSTHIRSTALERHRQRRVQGVPTLSVLLGDPELGAWCWKTWQRERGRSSVITSSGQLEGMLQDWLGNGALRSALLDAIVERAAAASGVSAAEQRARIGAHAAAQTPALVERLSRDSGVHAATVGAALCEAEGALPEFVLSGPLERLGEIHAMLGDALPTLLLDSTPEPAMGWLSEACAALIRIAEAVPKLEIALSMSTAYFAAWRKNAPERTLALLRQGRIEVGPGAPSSPAGLRAPPAQQLSDESSATSRSELEEAPPLDARTPRRATATATNGGPSSLEYDGSEFARSRAELHLFRHLEGRTRTRGLFALNVLVPDRTLGKRIEVDLFCEALHIALEIDGYHHFRDSVAYRRDRNKDVVLQELGYLVVRVLASDVDEELDYVVAVIDQVVERARGERAR